MTDSTSAVTTVFSNIANNVVSQLAAACTNTDVSVSLLTGTGASFPSAPFYCSVEYEVMWCTNKVGDNLQVQRGVDGTLASAHPINAIIQIRNNAGLFLDAYDAIKELDAGIGTGAALPANVAYTDKTQTFTNKTIDVSNPGTGNVIIGNVQPDPSALNYANILINGGFDDWTSSPSVTLPAGTPTSGQRNAAFTSGWMAYGLNDSSITVARDTANTDPGFPSGYNCLLNVSTIQGTDFVDIRQSFTPGTDIGINDLKKIIGNPLSLSVRAKSISGNVQIKFTWYYNDGTDHVFSSSVTQIASTYTTYKFENQIPVPNINVGNLVLIIAFQGTGQVALDNVMLIIGPVATVHRPSFPSITNNRLAPNVQRANLLVNGGFDIMQRAAPVTGQGAFGPDRWQLGIAGGDSLSVAIEGTVVCPNSRSAMQVTYTRVSGPNTNIAQVLRKSDGPVFSGSPVSFKGSILGPVGGCYVQLSSDGSGAVPVSTRANNNAASFDTQLTATYNVPSDATYLVVTILFSTTGTYYFDNFMLVTGSVPADYVPMHPADDLARCLRYYQSFSGGYFPMVAGYGPAAAQAYTHVQCVRKPVAPTVTKNGTWAVLNCAQPTVLGSYYDSATMQIAITALGYAWSAPTDGVTQTLTFEANP